MISWNFVAQDGFLLIRYLSRLCFHKLGFLTFEERQQMSIKWIKIEQKVKVGYKITAIE